MRTNLSSQPGQPAAQDHLRCCDLAKIGLILAVAAGFICQGVIWLTM